MDPMDQPIEPDPTLTVSGGPAITLLVASGAGMVTLLTGIVFTITEAHRYLLPLTPVHRMTSAQAPMKHRAFSTARQKPNQQPQRQEVWARSEKMAWTPGDQAVCLISSHRDPKKE